MFGVVLGIAAAAAGGAATFFGAFASRRDASATIVFCGQISTLPVLLLLCVIIPPSAVATSDAIWGATAGATQVIGLVVLWRAMASGSIGTLTVIATVVATLVPVAVAISANGEAVNPLTVCAILTAAAAVYFAASSGRSTVQAKGCRAAMLGGLLTGFSIACLVQPHAASAFAPLLVARLFGLFVLLLLIRRTGERYMLSVGNRRLGLLPSVFGTLVLICFVLAGQNNMVTPTSILQSLAPVVTTLLAVRYVDESLSRSQAAGTALAVASTGLVVMG